MSDLMSIVWFINDVLVFISKSLDEIGYGDSSELISLTYIMLLLILFGIVVFLFEVILCKIFR